MSKSVYGQFERWLNKKGGSATEREQMICYLAEMRIMEVESRINKIEEAAIEAVKTIGEK